MEEREGWIDSGGHRTWFRVVGDLHSGLDPLLCLHGGPGGTHHYFTPLERLAEQGRAVVLYDQVGCGRSDRPDDLTWSLDLFRDEVQSVRDELGLERIHLLGTSWGGMLALEHALAGTGELTSLVLSSTLASAADWEREVAVLRDRLPPDVVATLARHDAAGTYDDPEYKRADEVFWSEFVYRGGPRPEIDRMNAERSPDVYRAVWGPNEWTVTGVLRGWDLVDRLGEIAVPTLVVRGVYDLCTPAIAETLVRGVSGARLVVFEHSSHMPVLEETERYLEVVGEFLAAAESA